jgi:hypothetical protein
VTVAGPRDAVSGVLRLADDGEPIALAPTGPYEFAATVPGARVRAPGLAIRIDAQLGDATVRFPSGLAVDTGATPAPPSRPLVDFSALGSAPPLDQPANTIGGTCTLVAAEGRRRVVRLAADRFTGAESWLGFRAPVAPISGDGPAAAALVIRGRRVLPQTRGFEIGLVMDDGTGYGTVVVLPPAWGEVRVPLDRLRLLWQRPGRPFSLEHLREITIGMGPYSLGPTGEAPHALELESISLGPCEDAWRVPCLARGAPLALLADGAMPSLQMAGDAPLRTLECSGPEPGSLGLRLEADKFEGMQCAGVELSVGKTVSGVRSAIGSYSTLVLRMRAGEARTIRCEVVLKEEDGTPFGTVVELTPEWRELRIPIADLRHFAHWESSPPGRGGEGDHLHPDRLRSIHLTFGAWLFPDTKLERHAVEVGYAGLER